MKENRLTQILNQLAQEGVPEDLDLHSAVHQRLEKSKMHSHQGDFPMKPSSSRLNRLLASSILIVLLLLAALLISPAGRAWAQKTAQAALSFFRRSDSDTLPIQSFQLTPIPQNATPDPAEVFNLTVAEAGQKAGFQALEPTWLPAILSYNGASYRPKDNRISLSYVDNTTGYGNGLLISEQPFQNPDCDLCTLVGVSAAIEKVKIGELDGEYVVGVWSLTEQGPVWENNPWLQRIRWQANGIAFEVLYMGRPGNMTKDELIAIANSMR